MLGLNSVNCSCGYTEQQLMSLQNPITVAQNHMFTPPIISFFFAELLLPLYPMLEHYHWRMLMPYLRTFWHFMPQNWLHQRIVYLIIAKFFAIVLRYNSKVRIVLYQYSKKKIILFTFSPWNFSLVCLIISVLFSLFLLCFSIYSLLSTDPNTILPSLWLLFLFFGCGWWRGSVVVVVFSVGHCGGCGFFFFFGCDWCLKGLWVVVGSDVWVVGRGWVRCLGRGWVVAEVGYWPWIGEASHGLSLISYRGSAS